ncbi:MAG: hypothetical protein WKF37_16835 [Bryobacteraceae bacterium]
MLRLGVAGAFLTPVYFFCSNIWAQKSTPVPQIHKAVAATQAFPSCLENGILPPLPPSEAKTDRASYEQNVLNFLKDGFYKNWCADKGVRDTGPFANKVYYGTHPAVLVYYSPAIAQWLASGRQGSPPPRSVIIKEQYPPPAARYAGQPLPPVTDWTVMIWDPSGSKDGWYWGEFSSDPKFPMQFDNDQLPFNYPSAGFGIYCLRCHSTASNNFTFASLRNIQGFPGQPVTYPDDGSWRGEPLPAAVHRPLPCIPRFCRRQPPTPASCRFSTQFRGEPGSGTGVAAGNLRFHPRSSGRW